MNLCRFVGGGDGVVYDGDVVDVLRVIGGSGARVSEKSDDFFFSDFLPFLVIDNNEFPPEEETEGEVA